METAVEWLVESLSIHFTFEQQMQFEGLFQQAKEMEKQQIIDFAYYFRHEEVTKKELEQYYNETFKNK